MARIESLSHRRLLLATAALCVTSLLGVACSESAEPSDTTERDLAADWVPDFAIPVVTEILRKRR